MTKRQLVVAATVVAVGAGVAGGTTGATTTTAAKPKWLTISGFWDGVTGPSVVGSASGRGWMGFISGGTHSTLGSLRHAGGRLSFAKTTLSAWNPMFIAGSQLLYHLPDVSGKPGALRAVPLLANGNVGTPRPVPDDPETLPPKNLDPAVMDSVEIGDRTVWLLGGSRQAPPRSYLWVCCSATGELVDLTRFIKQGRRNFFTQLGLDSKKRLWLAWLESSGGAVAGSVKLLELDPETLAPLTPTTATLAGNTPTRFELSCAAFCRVVMSDLSSGDLLASSPGRRSPTRMASGTREYPANLLAATDRTGHLTAAYVASRSPDPARAQVHEIEVVSGDARGLHPRRLGVVDLPDAVGPSDDLYQTAFATFVPGGLVYYAFYYPGGATTRVLAGFLPLSR
jgi:hypothetical protein